MFFRKQYLCGECGSQVGYRSRPRTITEKYFSRFLLLRPVRCGGCFRRSYQPVYVPVKERYEPNPTRAALA
jgi:hypothetical protein